MTIEFFLDWLEEYHPYWYQKYTEEELIEIAKEDYTRLKKDLHNHPWDCLCLLCR